MRYGPAHALPGDTIEITTDTYTDPFWQAAKQERLTACQCGECGTFRMPPTPYCPDCLSHAIEWPTLPGTGTVFSFAICTKAPFPGMDDLVYVPAVIDLDGAPGARLVTNVTGIDADDVTIGLKVSVDWTPIKDGWKLPIFRAV